MLMRTLTWQLHHPWDCMRLLFADQLLDNDRTLSYYDIAAGSTILVVLRPVPFQFYAQLENGEIVVLLGEPGTTIRNTKQQIHAIIGRLPERMQLLSVGGQRLEDDGTLSDYNISMASIVMVRHIWLAY